ncbi:coiled-coil domain-containing protein [Pseudoalteromonas piratica]|uniref:Bacteriophage tail tape measure N-terminal domain-containing protein n=1 Tax=Pseudoalteromonas piratica TaxID=1348114 RepID=A0A0A7EGL5_9GAMM|nr:hypothetical protein [Pseudoalteromonas piratica]AIY65201.1 hypothetical protein OM33_08535 [Pseudoalteromonas piratica]
MASKSYKTGILITGDAKGGVRALKLTKDELGKLNKTQKSTQTESKKTKAQMGNMLARFSGGVAIVGGLTAAVGLLAGSLRTQAIKEINATAQAFNVSTETLTEWTYAANKVGIGADKIGDIFKDTQDKIGDFVATGGGEAADIFENLGLSIDELKSKTPDQQLLAIAEGLDQVGTKGEKIFYLESLADEASRLLPLLENGAAGLLAAQEEARLLGVSLSEVDAAMVAQAASEFDRMGGLITGASNHLTVAMAPALSAVNAGIVDTVTSWGGWQDVFTNIVEGTVTGIGFVLDRVHTLRKVLKLVEIGWLEIGSGGMNALASISDVTAQVINAVLKPFTLTLATIANGWSQILLAAGNFLGDEGLVAMGNSLGDFASKSEGFTVSAEDIEAAAAVMNSTLEKSRTEFEELKSFEPSDNLANWWKGVKENAEAAAKAQAKANKEARKNGSSTNNNKSRETQIKKEQQALDKLIKKSETLNSSLSNTSDVIVSAFGSVAQQLDNMIAKQQQFAQLEAELAAQRIKYNDEYLKAVESGDTARAASAKSNLTQIGNAETNLADNRLQSNMNSYAGMARAAGQFFDEQSSAREKLHKIETAFAIVETALALKKAAANALTAITNQGSGDPYTAFARIAAMAALMAGLGVFSGSASGSAPSSTQQRQSNQGTGTILGDADAKSESILNALERAEELELDQYAEMRAMNSALNDLNRNITRLATSIVGNFGRFDENSYSGELGKVSTTSKLESTLVGGLTQIDPLGILDKIIGSFSSTKKSLVDSGITFFTQTMGDVIERGLVDAATYADIKTKKKKFWGLKSSTKYNTEYDSLDAQLSSELALIFTSMGDTLTEALDILGLDAANALESFVISIPNLSLKDLSGEEIEAELQAAFSKQADLMAKHLLPQIGEFQKVGEGLYDTLIRVAQEQAVFNRALDYTGQSLGDLTGLDMIGASQNIIELVGGIEALVDAASTYYSEFLTDTEQYEFLSQQLIQQFGELGLALPSTRDGFKNIIDGLDLSTESGQEMYAALMALLPILDQYYDAVENQKDKAAEAAEAERKLAERRKAFNDDIIEQINRIGKSDLELAALDLNDWYEQMKAEAEALGAETAHLETLYGKKRLEIAEQYINAAIDKAEQAREAANNAFAAAVDVEVSLYNERIDAINEFSLALSASIAEIHIAMGELSNIDYLGSVEASARENYQSSVEGGTIEEQLNALDELQAAILNRFNAELAGYDGLINTAKSNIDALNAERQTLTNTFEKAISNAQRDFDKLAATINKTASSIDAAIYKIESSLPGFDAIGYSNTAISGLYGNLTGEANADELARIEELNSAIAARYSQELAAINANQSAQEQAHSAQLASFDALNNAAKQLKQAADSLLISDLSSLTNAAQVDEAKRQFESLTARARRGDTEAMSQLQSVGSRYLELSRDYNPANYDSVFDSVHNVFEKIAPARNVGPAPHPRIAAFEDKKISLANSTIAELKALQELTAALEEKAAEELAANIADLTAAYESDSNAIADAIANQELELTEFEAAKLLLQQTTIAELEAIKLLLESLELEAADERDSAIAELEAKLSADLEEINETLEQEFADVRAVFAEEAELILAASAAQIDVLNVHTTQLECIETAIIKTKEAIELDRNKKVTLPPDFSPIDIIWPDPIKDLAPQTNAQNKLLERVVDESQKLNRELSAKLEEQTQLNKQLVSDNKVAITRLERIAKFSESSQKELKRVNEVSARSIA